MDLLIIVRLAKYRWRQLVILIVLGCTLTAAVIGLAELRSSSAAALEASVAGEQAGLPYAIQGADPAALRTLDSLKDLAAVRDTRTAATAGAREVPALLRTARTPGLPLGSLIEGRRALDATEATISESAAAGLGVALGDSVRLESEGAPQQRVRLVGLTVNPADVDDKLVVTIDPTLAADQVTVWLSPRDPYSIEALRPPLDSRALTYQSVGELVKVAVRSQPQALSALKYVPAGLAALLIVLMAGTLAALLPTARADAESLTAAGMPPYRAWRKLTGLAFGGIILGELAGVAIATAILMSFKRPISSGFGQRWLGVDVPWVTVFALIVVSGLLGAVARPVSIGAARLFRWLSVRTTSRLRASYIGAAAALVGAGLLIIATIARLQTPPAHASNMAPVGAVLLAAALPVVIVPAMHRGLGRATQAVARHLNAGLMIVSTVVIVIAILTGGYAARATHNAVVNEGLSGAPQPAGSYLVTEIPNDAAATLTQIYKNAGGHRHEQYDLPDEQSSRVRVTGTRLVRCMSEAGTLNPDEQPSDCYAQKTYSPINTIALSRDSSSRALADPGLVQKDHVGLLVFSGTAPEAVSIADTSARPDRTLGGNMPGLVLPPDGPVAQTADGTQPGAYDDQRSVAGAVTLGGTVASTVHRRPGRLCRAVDPVRQGPAAGGRVKECAGTHGPLPESSARRVIASARSPAMTVA